MRRVKRWGVLQLTVLVLLTSLFQVGNLNVAQAQTGPDVEAEAAILLDFETGRILYEKNADLTLPPASMTKMMTEYIILSAIEEGKLSWDQETSISDYVYQISQNRSLSNVPLREDGTYTIKELYQAMAIYSANGASIALAEAFAGSETKFVEMMNQKAAEIGLPDYQFVNVTGLNNSSLIGMHPEGTGPNDANMLSARSTAMLAYRLISDFPEVLDTASIPTMTFREGTSDAIDMINWNKMLPGLGHEYEGVDGLKTGFTDLAGACFTGTAERNGTRLISVVMKTADNDARFEETRKLLDYGFNSFERQELFPAGYAPDEQQTVEVNKGKEGTVPVATNAPLSVIVAKNEEAEEVYTPSFDISEQIVEAPAEKDTVVGKMNVSYTGEIDYGYIQGPDQSFGSVDIVTTAQVDKANWFVLGARAVGGFFVDLWNAIVSGIGGLFS
ncbi:serine hydrolase [Aureibacillus halotolerans]|nr:serine hydrolase [Aureibacillus halotolerans]